MVVAATKSISAEAPSSFKGANNSVRKVSGLEGAKNNIVNFSRFIADPKDLPYKLLGVGSAAAAMTGIVSAWAANQAMSTDNKDESNDFILGLSKLFSGATTVSFGAQFLQSLAGFASPASSITYGALALLNDSINGQPRDRGIKIATQIKSGKRQLEILEKQLQSQDPLQRVKIQSEIDRLKAAIALLADEHKAIQAKITLGTSLTLGLIGFTYMRGLSFLAPRQQNIDTAAERSSKPFPLKAYQIKEKFNRNAGFQDWLNLYLENGKKEIEGLFDWFGSLNPRKWKGTFLGGNEKVNKVVQDGFYEITPFFPVHEDKFKISLRNNDGTPNNLRKAAYVFGESAAPFVLTGLTAWPRLLGLAGISSALLFYGYNSVAKFFQGDNTNKTHPVKKQSGDDTETSILGLSNFLIQNVGVPVHALGSIISGLSPLNISINGLLSTQCLTGGGLAYLASILTPNASIADLLKMAGTLTLLLGNSAAILKIPSLEYLKTKGIKSFSEPIHARI